MCDVCIDGDFEIKFKAFRLLSLNIHTSMLRKRRPKMDFFEIESDDHFFFKDSLVICESEQLDIIMSLIVRDRS